MRFETRLTLGISLLYLLNGLFNLFGESGSFAPLVFLDNFLLALVCLFFVFLPPFSKLNSVFGVFTLYFIAQGLFVVGYFQDKNSEIGINVLFLTLLSFMYVLTVWTAKQMRFLFYIPTMAFFLSFTFAFLDVHPLVKLSTSVCGALVQLYILARPDLVEHMHCTLKRFYLLTLLIVFFDLLYMIFIYTNTSV